MNANPKRDQPVTSPRGGNTVRYNQGWESLKGPDLPLYLARYWRAQAAGLRRQAQKVDEMVANLEREAAALALATGAAP